MSAYIVGHDHIDALLTFATTRRSGSTVSYWIAATGNRVEITTDNADKIGRILLRENERSVAHRYGRTRPLPGTIGQEASSYTFRHWGLGPLQAISILKACDCYDYQACETGEVYYQSVAFAIISAIRSAAIHALPGYDATPGWEFRRERPAATHTTKCGETAQ
jgi:hypothetical protein